MNIDDKTNTMRCIHQESARLFSNPPATCSYYTPSTEAYIKAVIERAGQLNREGISILLSGNGATAVTFFRAGLEQLEQLRPYLTPGQETSCTPPQDCASLLFGATAPILQAIDLAQDFQDRNCNYIYLYDKALDFLPDIQMRFCTSTRTRKEDTFDFQVAFYSAIIMFNVGVCLHLRGNPRRDEGILVTAVHFYDLAVRQLSSIPIVEYSDKLMMIMLAIWNNQAQIYYQLGSYEHAIEVLEGVRRLSARLLLERPTSLDTEDQEHIHEFVLNVVTVRVPNTAPCA